MMRSFPQAILVVVAAALASACTRPQPDAAGHFRGTIQTGCAPHDASSTWIQLRSDDSETTLEFNIWPPLSAGLPAVVRFPGGTNEAQAVYCTGPEECQLAAWGEIVLAGSIDGTGGTWTLGLDGDRVLSGSFEAETVHLPVLCG